MADTKIENLKEEDHERLKKNYIAIRDGKHHYIKTIPGNYIFPSPYEKFKERIYHFKTRSDDVFVVTWPKNGTTWTQEMAWCVQNNANVEAAKTTGLNIRVPFIDFSFIAHSAKVGEKVPYFEAENLFKMIDDMKSPRIFKSHLPFELLPKNLLENNKVIICLRNPKDTLVSYYHHEKLIPFHGYIGDFATFFDLFMDELVIYSSYWNFTLQAWKERHRPNVCLLFFEDMKKDLGSSIRKVARFLEKELSEDQVESLIEHLSFKKMKDNQAINDESMRKLGIFNSNGRFMRKGEVGDWKNYFTEEMNERMNKAIEEHFKDTGLTFIYE